jgi:hypothetical protein
MSTTFEAHATRKEGAVVEVRVHIVHPQQFQFYESKSFALQLLWDATPPSARARVPLTSAVSVNQISDPGWVLGHEGEFIKSVEVLETSNYPIEYEWDEMTESEQDALFKDKSKLASALYRIEATRPEWVEGVSPSQRWDSGAADFSNYL